MRTIKVVGSGPLAGFVSYCMVWHMDIVSDDGVVMTLDEPGLFGEREFTSVTVSALTGALKTPHGETDLITVADEDREYLKTIWNGWYGRSA